MRHPILSLVFLVCYVSGNCQTALRNILSSAGTEHQSQNTQINWTLGELSIESVDSEGHILTQGFQQADIIITGLIDLKNPTKINLYPNPTNQLIHVDLKGMDRDLKFILYDLHGRALIQIDSDHRNKFTIDLSGLPEGIYMLTIPNTDPNLHQSFRILKMQ